VDSAANIPVSRTDEQERSILEVHHGWSITSNVVFSEWDRIFKDPMTTAAAIDRLVHHSVILEMTGTIVRAETAEQAKKEGTTTARGKHHVNEVDGEV
jgi:hypothetical protein